MRVAILNITSGGMSGGYRKYLKYILPPLIWHNKISSLFVAVPEDINKWQKNFPMVYWTSMGANKWFNSEIENDIRDKVKKFAADIIFIPTARFLEIKGVPTVVMIRNMEPLAYSNKDNPVREKIKNIFRTQKARKAAIKADRIISVSKYVKGFLIEKWNIPADKIGTVYHGATLSLEEDIKQPLAIPKDWNKRFLFTAGSIRPARGLEDALSALKHLSDQSLVSELVIAGETVPDMMRYQNNLRNWIQKNNLSSKVCWVGNLNEKEMNWCYKNCSAFIMTSRAEACPNIVLEAMANGCICVSTKTPPMPEFFKDLAFYYTPEDSLVLSQAIKQALEIDSDKRCGLSERAKKRAAEFSWDLCAEKTVAELKKAVQDFRLRSENRGRP